MTLTISEKTISIEQNSFDTQLSPFYRILINLKEKKLVLESCKEDQKNAIDLSKPVKANAFIQRLRETFGQDEKTLVFKGKPAHNGFCFDLDDPITLESADDMEPPLIDVTGWRIAKTRDFQHVRCFRQNMA